MKVKLFVSLLFVVVISYRCNNNTGSTEKAANEQSVIKTMPVYLIDSVEHFFGNENWRVIDGRDTAYMLFSRQNAQYIKVYHYQLSQGDSVRNSLSEITIKGDSVYWSYPAQPVVLQKAMNNEMDWVSDRSATDPISFRRAATDKIVLTQAGKEIRMDKTITMADFLVRTKYDYSHGTHYATDTVTFNWRRKKDGGRALIKTGN